MNIILIATAFVFGFVAKQIGLPPLIGFLAAGFVLNLFGVEDTQALHQLPETGIILLLFSIGYVCCLGVGQLMPLFKIILFRKYVCNF